MAQPDQSIDAQPIMQEMQALIGESALHTALLRAQVKALKKQTETMQGSIDALTQQLQDCSNGDQHPAGGVNRAYNPQHDR